MLQGIPLFLYPRVSVNRNGGAEIIIGMKYCLYSCFTGIFLTFQFSIRDIFTVIYRLD